MALQLNSQWIEDAMADRASGESNVIVVQTADPMRAQQFMASLATHFPSALYQFRPWMGLEAWLPAEKKFTPVTTPVSSEYDSTLQNDLRDLGSALRHMDKLLRADRAKSTAFVLRDLDNTGETATRNTDLINALRCWGSDNRITAQESVICLIAAQPSLALDAHTLDSAILARPDQSCDGERLSIVKEFAEEARLRIDGNSSHLLSSATRGLNLHQVRVVLRKSWAPSRRLTVEDVKHHKASYIRRSDVLEIEEPSVSFQDVGGYEAVKAMVRNDFIDRLREVDRTKQAAVELPRGLLLFGPGGVGKSLFGRSLARETNLPFINFKTEDIFSQYLGVSGQRLRDAIRMAEAASPAIIFIDEVDRFGRRTGAGSDGASQETQRVFSQMLEWLGREDRKSIVVGTTNVPEHLDPTFVRPGRLNPCVPFLYPDRVAREQILTIHLGLARPNDRRRPEMDEKEVRGIIPEIAEATDYYAGCDLKDLVDRAKSNFFRDKRADRLLGRHLRAAHEDYKIDRDSRIETANRYQKMGDVFASSIEMLRSLGHRD